MSDASPPKSSAGRSRRRRKEARPSEIIEAGLKEFAARGFAATRLEDVARRAGVAKGTIYLYFADKEALFVAAVQSRVTPVIAGMADLVADFPGSTRDLLTLMIRTAHAKLVEGDLKVVLRILIAEGGNFPGLVASYHRDTVARGRAVLEAIYRRGVERGEFRTGATADLPVVIMAPAIMAALWKMIFEAVDPIAADRFLAAHLDLVLNGVLAPPDGKSPSDRAGG